MNVDLKCEAVEPQLTALALGEIPAHEASRLRAHLATCDACRAAAEDIAATLAVVRVALAAEAAPTRLDAVHRPVQNTPWRAVVREWLDLPASGPVALSLWPGAFAKAALILIIPMTVALGLLIPGVRMAWNVATNQELSPSEKSESPESAAQQGYVVEIRPAVELAERDSIETNAVAATAATTPAGVSTAAFEAAAKHWNGESIVNNALPDGRKLGLGMNPEQQAIDLAHATAPIPSPNPERVRALPLEWTFMAPASQRRDPRDGKFHLVSTAAAAPPPATNAAIATNSAPASSKK